MPIEVQQGDNRNDLDRAIAYLAWWTSTHPGLDDDFPTEKLMEVLPQTTGVSAEFFRKLAVPEKADYPVSVDQVDALDVALILMQMRAQLIQQLQTSLDVRCYENTIFLALCIKAWAERCHLNGREIWGEYFTILPYPNDERSLAIAQLRAGIKDLLTLLRSLQKALVADATVSAQKESTVRIAFIVSGWNIDKMLAEWNAEGEDRFQRSGANWSPPSVPNAPIPQELLLSTWTILKYFMEAMEVEKEQVRTQAIDKPELSVTAFLLGQTLDKFQVQLTRLEAASAQPLRLPKKK